MSHDCRCPECIADRWARLFCWVVIWGGAAYFVAQIARAIA